MKICFIWIEKYRNFENFSLNLSSSSKFNFDLTNNLLSCDSCKPLPQDFFGHRIDEVTGLIGRNGSGKSNALALICNALKNSKLALNSKFLIITEENGLLTCHYSFKSDFKPDANFDIDVTEYVGELKELKVIYFSNVFNRKRNNFGKEVSDISVKSGIPFEYKNRLKKNDFEKQISLINSRLFKKINIDLPNKVRFTSKRSSRFNVSSYYREHGSVPNLKKLNDLFKSRLRDITGKNKFFHLVRLSFFEYTLRLRIESDEYSIFLREADDLIKQQVSAAQKTEEISENLVKFISNSFPIENSVSYEAQRDRRSGLDLMNISEKVNFLVNIQEYFSPIDIEYSSEGLRSRLEDTFEISYDSKSKDLIERFIFLFRDSLDMDTDWNGISSGHLAYLNLFSSIHDELKNTRQKSLLLCIDEGDLYLHPFWQVEFFSKLLSVLPEMFRGNLQIILTSHSPFLLSDLPNQCITILDQSTVSGSINGIDLKGQTFGANLYDLYAEPFFLGEKKMSTFAYEKIANYLKIIEKSSRSNNKSQDDISYLIGDDVIRFKIQKLFNHD